MIPLYKPYMPEKLPELDVILHSGALSYGKWGKEFEIALKKFIECDESPLIVNSFSAVVQLVLLTLDIKSGDEIIASPQCCLASTQPLRALGIKVKWADVDPLRGTLDPDSVVKKITPKTKLIWHNHHCGYPGFIDEINTIAHQHGLLTVDDCIEAFGSEYHGKKLGNVGTDITVFSFQTVRLPNTIDGGGVIFRNQEFYKKAIQVRDLGVNRLTFRNSLGEISPNCDIKILGLGITCNEISSYIGWLQMQNLEHLLKRQQINAFLWNKYLCENYPDCYSIVTNDAIPNYWVFGVLSDKKNELIEHFRKSGYYASGVHLPNTYYSIFGKQDRLLGVEQFSQRFFALPCGWWCDSIIEDNPNIF